MSVLSLVPQDKRKDLLRKESLETVYTSNSRLNLLQKRKKLTPSFHSEMSSQTLSSKAADKYVTQRVLSAKTHRVKQLQNQLADAHYHLQELSNENRVLRALQKKHEIALQRYENSNAELPQVLNSHSEEMRVQVSRYKQVKQQLKDVSQKLKDRDLQLQQLRDEHTHLLELTKDRSLPEREKLQSQVSELSQRVQQQSETISTLQRRLVLEAKNYRHQLQQEINRHKDTRHDLDLAITNADKLSTIIEMKEKLLSTVASRGAKSPTKLTGAGAGAGARQVSKMTKPVTDVTYAEGYDDRASGDQNITRFCENSRSLSSALSHDEDTSSSLEPKSRYVRSRLNSSSTGKSTPAQTRNSSKNSEDLIEIAKTVQDGMAELSIFQEEIDLKNPPNEDTQKKIELMKMELLKKINNDEDPELSRTSSAVRRKSIEEDINEVKEVDRPKSRGRQTSFYDDVSVEENLTTVTINNYKPGDELKQKRESNSLNKTNHNKPIEKYCKDIIQDIEKSSKVIDRHIKEFSDSKFDSDKLVQQLQAVDKINEYVNAKGEIPQEAFEELNNNFKMLTDQVLSESVAPIVRKRSISGRRPSKVERTNLFGDASMSNQDLLEDLLGKK